MGELLELFRDGRITRREPPGALPLEAGCDWGYCDRDGYAWRWSGALRTWLVVCVRCAFAPGHPTGTGWMAGSE